MSITLRDLNDYDIAYSVAGDIRYIKIADTVIAAHQSGEPPYIVTDKDAICVRDKKRVSYIRGGARGNDSAVWLSDYYAKDEDGNNDYVIGYYYALIERFTDVSIKMCLYKES